MKPPATDTPDVSDASAREKTGKPARRDTDELRAGWSAALERPKQALEES